MSKDEYKKKIINSMKQNGNYSERYDIVIDQLAELQEMARDLHQHLIILPDVIIEHTDKSDKVKMVVNPIYKAYISIERCICIYLNELGLGAK